LPELIDRVLGGEEVVISRAGRPVAALRAVAPEPKAAAEPKRLSPEGLAWLIAYQPVGEMPDEDAGAFISRMRDEDTH
jgi:antitoxin (DNA-binding transcriptional repressor) of toxin-antitoxin stability system